MILYHTWTIFWQYIFISAWVCVDSDWFLQWNFYPPVHTKLVRQILLHKYPSLTYNILMPVPINILVLLNIEIFYTQNVHPIINSRYVQLAQPIKLQHFFLWYLYDIIVHMLTQLLLSYYGQFLSKKFPATCGITCSWVYSWTFCTDIPYRFLWKNI